MAILTGIFTPPWAAVVVAIQSSLQIPCLTDVETILRVLKDVDSEYRQKKPQKRGLKIGCSGWDRTSDQEINSLLLYR
tara:strand:- start:154212 stop:154445 length:234 start_codon:yes stop_codon:yes gene_type:complete